MKGKKKASALETARSWSFLMMCGGLSMGVFYSFGGAVYDFFTTGFNEGTWLAFGALVGMPLLGAMAGFVLGLVWYVFCLFVKLGK